MRHGYWLAVVVTGCGFRSPSAAPPDGTVPGEGGGADVAEVWSLDLKEDFAAGQLVNMTIESRGSLTPNGYTYGGLVAHGLQGTRVWENGDPWEKLSPTVVPSGTGLWCGEHFTNGFKLDNLGITNDSLMTVWLEGEVWLEAGSNERFTVAGDDVAMVYLADPGSTSYRRIVENGTAQVATPVTGWYPIRVGTGNAVTNNNFEFTHSDNGGPPVPWTRERMRARTSELAGAMRTVFAEQILGGGVGALPPVNQLERASLLDLQTFLSPPLGTTGNDNWSARYVAQLYVEAPGRYMLRVASDDGNRVRLGSGRDESSWRFGEGVGADPRTSTAMADLVAGWNDLAVDYNQVGGNRELAIEIAGPDYNSVARVPRDRLRPVDSADERLASAGATPGRIPDGDDLVATMRVGGFPGETVTGFDLTYEISSNQWTDLVIELERPGLAARGTLRNRQGDGNGAHVSQFTVVPATPNLGALVGGAAGGDWRLRITDVNTNGTNNMLINGKLTLHTIGGPEKIARTASWVSPVRELPTRVVAIDAVTRDERVPPGASIVVSVRACTQASCSDNPAWAPAPVQAPLAVSGRYLQLKVDMTSDGLREPELRSLMARFRRDP